MSQRAPFLLFDQKVKQVQVIIKKISISSLLNIINNPQLSLEKIVLPIKIIIFVL